jgi:hypothetical protein
MEMLCTLYPNLQVVTSCKVIAQDHNQDIDIDTISRSYSHLPIDLCLCMHLNLILYHFIMCGFVYLPPHQDRGNSSVPTRFPHVVLWWPWPSVPQSPVFNLWQPLISSPFLSFYLFQIPYQGNHAVVTFWNWLCLFSITPWWLVEGTYTLLIHPFLLLSAVPCMDVP